MAVDGFDKKSYGILPAAFSSIDIEFSYSKATYSDLAQVYKKDIYEIMENGDSSDPSAGDDSDV